ncbi:MAG: LPS export ABC transporter periplasmic protein LptC [Gammaproteobacteria bacterium]|nr:LPS export ABC transporter periplasmic protein LptC [Gammaproteobacteria bacterium]
MRSPAQRRQRLTQRVVAVAASLAGLASLYVLLASHDGTDVETGEAKPQRGYYLLDSTMTEMGPDGRVKSIVHARAAEQQLSDQSVNLTDIAIDYPTQKYGDWHATARTGHMPADRKTIQLAGDVVMTSAQKQGAAVIRTDRLDYDIDGGVVQTPDVVDVQFGPHVLKARGLRADLKAQTLKLESNVNGRFSP